MRTRLITKVLFIFSLLGSGMLLLVGLLVVASAAIADTEQGEGLLALGVLAWVGSALIVYSHVRDREMVLVVYVMGVLPGTLACLWAQLLVGRAPPVGEGAIQCPSCGLTLEDGATLCTGCGSRLSG